MKEAMNEVTTINRNNSNDDNNTPLVKKYNQTDGSNPKTSPASQKAITIINSIRRNISVEGESFNRRNGPKIPRTQLKQQQNSRRRQDGKIE
jgi:hypothetical protein